MKRAMIFDIQRNSLVDGPGIRTTVFFKGCNLHCAWCHNPESQSAARQMMIYENKCTGCGKCKEVCPYNLKQCDFCGKCVIVCPNDARKICGTEMNSAEIFAEIKKDRIFYESSGGGVTFSGGECMLQPDFLVEILKICTQNGIHTAVDTAGCVPWESFEKILPYTDLFLYDVKIMDAQKHTKYIGADNSLILENLNKIAILGKDIVIRVPIIGGINDTVEEIEKIAELAEKLHINKVELLPYHAMGDNKYSAIGRECEKFTVPSDEKMQELRNILK